MKWLIYSLFFSNLFANPEQTTTIIFVGDSLTEGLGVDSQRAYPALIEKMFKEKNKLVKSINLGTSGATSASAISKVKWGLKSKPQIMVLCLGANDAFRGQDVDAMKKNLVSAIDIAEKEGIKVLLAGMKSPPNLGKKYSTQFENAFQEIAKERKSIHFLPFILEGAATQKKLNQDDGIHPNEQGHQVMAASVFKVLETML